MHRGLLDKLVQIQKRTLDQDSSGQPLNTWTTVAIVYAQIKPVTGRAFLAASQMPSELTHDITIAYFRGIRADMRILHAGRYFELIAPPLDPDERREWLYLKCKEVPT